MKKPKGIRGIYERDKGSGIWWIRYTDSDGRKRREKVGSYSNAKALLSKRHTAVIQGEKLPEFGKTKTRFAALCDDAIKHSKAANGAKHTYDLETRIQTIKNEFGTRPADSIRKSEIVDWLTEKTEEREWSSATRNRWQACFSLIFRVGIEDEKIQNNPAAKIRRKTENNEHVRFLSNDEQSKLTTAIENRFPEFLPHLLVSIHTGMRMSEQYSLRWEQVNFEREQIFLPKTKNGDARAIPLNAISSGALKHLHEISAGVQPSDPVFPSNRAEEGGALQGSRGWFPTAVQDAGIEHYWWHCNRHTFASRLVMAGVDLLTVATLLGHRTLQMVKRYAHLAPKHQADAVARLVSGEGRTDTETDTDTFGELKKRNRKSAKEIK